MQYRLLALDMDGTLLNDEKQVSDHNRDTLFRAMEQGVQVALISGRPLASILPTAKILELQTRGGYIAALNSGIVLDCKTGMLLCERRVRRDAALRICSAAEQAGLATVGYDDETVFTNNAQDPYAIEEAYNNRLPLRAVTSMADCAYPSLLYVVMGEQSVLREFYQTQLPACPPDVQLAFGSPTFLNIMASNVSKANAAKILMAHLGLQEDQLMACGDGLNDLPLLSLAGLGVAMGNACDAVKKTANVCVSSNLQYGVAEAVSRYILSERA